MELVQTLKEDLSETIKKTIFLSNIHYAQQYFSLTKNHLSVLNDLVFTPEKII